MPLLLTRQQAAGYMNVSLSTIDKLRKEKAIPTIRVRGSVRLHREHVIDYLVKSEGCA